MAVDGYLNFDTKINTSGFEKGRPSYFRLSFGFTDSIFDDFKP